MHRVLVLALYWSVLAVLGWDMTQLLQSVREYDIVYPRLTRNTRTKRQASSPDQAVTLEVENWVLELRPNPWLTLKQGLQVEWVGSGYTPEPEDCVFMAGSVRGEQGSVAAMVTCDTGGVTGMIQLGNSSYFVQPLQGVAHIMYRSREDVVNLDSDQEFDLGRRHKRESSRSRDDVVNLDRDQQFDLGRRQKRESSRSREDVVNLDSDQEFDLGRRHKWESSRSRDDVVNLDRDQQFDLGRRQKRESSRSREDVVNLDSDQEFDLGRRHKWESSRSRDDVVNLDSDQEFDLGPRQKRESSRSREDVVNQDSDQEFDLGGRQKRESSRSREDFVNQDSDQEFDLGGRQKRESSRSREDFVNQDRDQEFDLGGRQKRESSRSREDFMNQDRDQEFDLGGRQKRESSRSREDFVNQDSDQEFDLGGRQKRESSRSREDFVNQDSDQEFDLGGRQKRESSRSREDFVNQDSDQEFDLGRRQKRESSRSREDVVNLDSDQEFEVGRRNKRDKYSSREDFVNQDSDQEFDLGPRHKRESSRSRDDAVNLGRDQEFDLGPRHKRESSRSREDVVNLDSDQEFEVGRRNKRDKYSSREDFVNQDSDQEFDLGGRHKRESYLRQNLTEELVHKIREAEDDVGYLLDSVWDKVSRKQNHEARRKEFRVKAPQRWLEMALAVDHTVIEFHGADRVQQYVLALMNIVSAIYKDPSLDSNLQLVIVRLIFYEDEHSSQVHEGNSKRSLENVNRWNERLLRGEPEPHDVAVWLTRADLGGPSGYAPVSGACDPSRSCTLNRDEGLSSAFIIAHEVAHVLGLTHDGDVTAGNDCGDEALEGSVMAPMVSATFHRFSWSSCSKKEFHMTVARWQCLRNEPRSANATLLKSELQATFTMDEQCRMEFGEGYSLCRSLNLPDPCSHLWCGHVSAPLVCKTKKGPPLEGTECGVNHWCMAGYCEMMDRRRFGLDPVTHNPRDGGWSSWSSWTPCSRSCGFGVSFRSRSCNNPRPAYGGAECVGKSEEFQLCGKMPCPLPLRDVRAQQCSRLPILVPSGGLGNHRVNHTWLPHEADPESLKCQLTCMSRESGEVFLSGENLLDGTPCSYDSRDSSICIQGHCQKLGCDGELESTVQEDACGICGGNGSQCLNITNIFQRRLRRAMTRVSILPLMARMVQVTVNLTGPGLRLVIRDRRGHTYGLGPSPQSLLGSVTVWTLPAPHSVIVEGARFHYKHTHKGEVLWAHGPLLAELVVSVSAMEVTGEQWVSVQTNYSLLNLSSSAEQRYKWQVGGWGPCSHSCGGGRRHKTVACRDTQTGRLVARRRCSLTTKPPPQVQRCNVISCDFEWLPGEWEGCTATCGSRGVQERLVYCVHNGTGTGKQPWQRMVHPKKCNTEPMPDDTRPCNRVPCPVYWVSGNWTQCSATCGRGLQSREYRCPAPRGEPLFDCGPSPPDEQRPCRGIFRRSDPLCHTPRPCRGDASKYCRLTSLLGRYCVIPSFRKLCCKSCSVVLNTLPE